MEVSWKGFSLQKPFIVDNNACNVKFHSSYLGNTTNYKIKQQQKL